jgi:hypothetical protein
MISYLFYEGRPLTTKGRWINKWVFRWLALQEKITNRKKVDTPIFILGTGRSGTTILGITLSAHKKIGFLNEPKALWHHLYKDEDLIGSYNKQYARYRLYAEDVDSTLKKRAHLLYANYLRFSFSDRVVDKYPELIFRYEFIKKIFPDAKFIFLSRNGWDTCASISKWSERLGIKVDEKLHDWWGENSRKWYLLCDQIVVMDTALGSKIDKIKQYKSHKHRAAVEWIVTMKQGIKLADAHPESVYHLEYEDYIASRQTRHHLLKFCHIIPDASYEKYSESVLRPSKSWNRFELPEEIQSEFLRVMIQLNYDTTLMTEPKNHTGHCSNQK